MEYYRKGEPHPPQHKKNLEKNNNNNERVKKTVEIIKKAKNKTHK